MMPGFIPGTIFLPNPLFLVGIGDDWKVNIGITNTVREGNGTCAVPLSDSQKSPLQEFSARRRQIKSNSFSRSVYVGKTLCAERSSNCALLAHNRGAERSGAAFGPPGRSFGISRMTALHTKKWLRHFFVIYYSFS